MRLAAEAESGFGPLWSFPECHVQCSEGIEEQQVISLANDRLTRRVGNQIIAHVMHEDGPALAVPRTGEDGMRDLRRKLIQETGSPDEHLSAAIVSRAAHDPVGRGRGELDDEARSLSVVRLDCQEAAP